MSNNSIIVKKYSDVIEEFVATETITPGMLLEFDSTGKVKKHDVAGGNVYPMFALEDELQGKGIDDDYASTDPVQVWIPGCGDIVRGWLADGQNVAIGDWLISNGAGKLTKWTLATSGGVVEYPELIVGRAAEAVNMTVSNDPSGRIKVRVC
jgi:hypothetical protein